MSDRVLLVDLENVETVDLAVRDARLAELMALRSEEGAT